MGDLSMGTILLGIFFGSLGGGYFIYGKRQENWVALVAGLILCVIPYFITNVWLLFLAGGVLAAAPFISKRWI